MKSTIVFMDHIENSKRGTLRGFVIFPIFIIMTIIWYFLTKKLYVKHIDKVSTSRLWFAFLMCTLLIVSALGVHTPDTAKKALVYGLLVGFVIYGISNLTLLAVSNKWDYFISLIDTLWGIISTGILSLILFYIVKSWPYINVV